MGVSRRKVPRPRTVRARLDLNRFADDALANRDRGTAGVAPLQSKATSPNATF